MFNQYKISDLIKALQKQKKQHGDLLVSISIDEEGNEFNPVGVYIDDNGEGRIDTMIPFSVDEQTLTIWP